MKTIQDFGVLVLVLIATAGIDALLKYYFDIETTFAAGFMAGAVYYDGYKKRNP